MWDTLLNAEILEGPLLYGTYAVGALFVLYLLGKSASARWIAVAVIALGVGAAAGFAATFLAVDLVNVFGTALPDVARWWVMAAFAGFALALANLWVSRWWRKLIAVLAVPIFAVVAVVGINAEYRAARSVGQLIGAVADVVALLR